MVALREFFLREVFVHLSFYHFILFYFILMSCAALEAFLGGVSRTVPNYQCQSLCYAC